MDHERIITNRIMGVMSACKGVLAINGELLLVFVCCCCRRRGPKISLTQTQRAPHIVYVITIHIHYFIMRFMFSRRFGLHHGTSCVFSMQRDSSNEFIVRFIKRKRFDDDRNIVDYLNTGMRLEMHSPNRIMHTSTHINRIITFPKIYDGRNFAIH